MITKLWNKASVLGVSKDDLGSKREVVLLNKLVLICSLIIVAFIPFEVILNGWKLVPIEIASVLLFSVPLLLNKYHLHVFAIYYIVIVGTGLITLSTYAVGGGSESEYNLLPIMLLPLLFLNRLKLILPLTILVVITFFFIKFNMDQMEALIYVPLEIKAKVKPVMNVMTMIFLFLELYYFKTINQSFLKKLNAQKEIIEEKHKEITDSILYAERIQRSFLATNDILNNQLGNYFVFFKPKDVVSGDFYWASELNNGNFSLAVADSTGHGVPGAIMSILNISSLEKAIETQSEPNKILNITRQIIIDRLKRDGSSDGGKDGMDCSLLILNPDRSQLTFASANNPVILIREGVILEFKPDKMPVGKHHNDQESFTNQTVDLKKGDVIYALTDGFPDQFGGEKGKKYMIKNLKNFLLSISHLPMAEQQRSLETEFSRWKGDHEQVDDVCILGIEI